MAMASRSSAEGLAMAWPGITPANERQLAASKARGLNLIVKPNV
jgi:hypothetical protein